jgi:predicted MFS family arabinose efflux permease
LAFLGLSQAASASPLVLLVGAGFVGGGAHGFLYPGLAALVTDQASPVRRGAVVGVFSAVFLVGHTAGAFFFGYVVHALGYGPMWGVLTALLLGGAGLSLRLAGGMPDTAAA